MAISTDILFEYEKQLKMRYHIENSDGILKNLLENRNVKQFIPDYKWQLISKDPDDNKFVDCAITSNADYIVTNDKHFNILKEIPFPKVNIITIQEFIKMFWDSPYKVYEKVNGKKASDANIAKRNSSIENAWSYLYTLNEDLSN